ncbi:hypothetical protein PAAG_11034 [Paracoccidioides lutzii Pb01]|uniref:Uncharacterized protein n=1 Tax=Paracoccidioides lutzii (strain ATCC MYA-826 / Pb01) TaxID=502779 RepID=A0A0A2V7M3_PARBA|nr:hypothetical protein PAAG_11034 [Paracoccidioides lutzii Pb01]KGQ02085.1 hypothetical protein PAAG_11034 [Paracoccidioides lutzii Pb01]
MAASVMSRSASCRSLFSRSPSICIRESGHMYRLRDASRRKLPALAALARFYASKCK